MINKLLRNAIAVAIAGTAIATTAHAETTLYGRAHLSIDSTDFNQPGGEQDTNLRSNASRFGVKGSEDLGNGLSAIYQLEYEVDITGAESKRFTPGPETSTTSVKGRDQWLGIKSDFGKVRAGTIATLYKDHGKNADPFWDTSLEARELGMQSGLHTGSGTSGEGRATHTIRFDSADYSGFNFGATYTFDNDKTDAEDNDTFGLGGEYTNGPVNVFADYLTNDNGGDDSAWKLGGSVTFGDAAVYAQYEVDDGLISQRSNGFAVNNTTKNADIWMLGGSYTIGNTMLYAAYGQGDDEETGGVSADTSYDVWELAVMHKLSKRTKVYGGYANMEEDAAGGIDLDFISVGMQHDF